jgi:hypothetical protein
MKKTMKWIIGIVVSLIVLAVIVGVGYLVISHWTGAGRVIVERNIQPWGNDRTLPWRDMPTRPSRALPGLWFGGFPVLRMISGGLVCLGFVALIVLGVIALVRWLKRSPKTAVASQPAVAPVSVAAPETASEPAPAAACPNCGQPVQPDWSHCPYCGADLPASIPNP